MQQPNNGYIWLVKATSEKHFDLCDREFTEVASGCYLDMLEKMKDMHTAEYEELIHLVNWKSNSLVVTTEDGLKRMLELDSNYLNDKEFL